MITIPDRTVSEMRADCAAAFLNAQRYHRELAEIYRYYMPFRRSTAEQAPQGGGATEGARLTDALFDGTGVEAAFNFAGNMQSDWMPPFEQFFLLEPGPLIPPDERPELATQLQSITDIAHGVLSQPRLAAYEMFLDEFAGTGAMFLAEGDDRQPVRGLAVPVIEIALENGPWGDVEHIYWRRMYKARQLPVMWPDGKFSNALAKVIREDRDARVEVTQYTWLDRRAKRWRLKVWCNKDGADDSFWDESFRTNPWITPRFFKVPGETFGRGLAHLGLPFVKTSNKARELALKAAAFALMGLWMRRNDSVFNPDTVRFEPLAMWQVASTGGPLGATLQRLPVPQDFDVSSIVMAEEREQIKRVLLDDEMPADELAVRSATEIAGRMKRYARRRAGTGSRIALEMVTPLAQRTVDILESSGRLRTNLTIDQLLLQATVTAPAASAQRADRVERAVNWMQMIVMLFGPEAALLAAKVEDLIPEMGRWMGNEERFIRPKQEAEQLRDMIAKMVAAQQEQAQAAKDKPPPPGQQYVNGGAV